MEHGASLPWNLGCCTRRQGYFDRHLTIREPQAQVSKRPIGTFMIRSYFWRPHKPLNLDQRQLLFRVSANRFGREPALIRPALFP
jgi:hypothetical protein